MEEPSLRKKNLLKAQYIYNAVLLLVLTLGISYAVVTFLYNEEGTSGNIVSSLVNIKVDEDTSFSLGNTSPVTDEVGLTGYSKTLTLTNTSTIDSLVNVTLNPDAGNDIDPSYIKYGLYINGVLKKTGDLSDTSIYDGLLLQGEKLQFEVYLWVDSSYTGTGTIFNGTFSVTSTEAVMTMADYVTKLVDKGKGVYQVGNDYRYSGLDADNYIWFNCNDGTTGGASNCEKWQIVGSLETKANSYANAYRRVKIVKVDSLDNKVFGDNNTFSSSSIHTYLNGDYYASLTNQAKKMVIGSEWNVGSSVLTNTPGASLTSEQVSKLYTKVGLLSASDIGYSTNTDNHTKSLNDADLYTNSWLKGNSYYTLTPVTDTTTNVIGDNATTLSSLDVATATGIKPVVSLIPNVYIKAGNGTSDNPYELAIVDEVEHYSNVGIVGYITYDVNGQTATVPSSQPIFTDGSTVITRKLDNTAEYKFAGWATSADGDVVYQVGDTITATGDTTLYAKWKSMANYLARKNTSYDGFWPTSINSVRGNITQVNFVSLSQEEIDTRYGAATIKGDVTDTTKSDAGSVLAWLETDPTDATKYIMHIASDGITYFPSICQSMFYNFTKLTGINFNNINTTEMSSTVYMFYRCIGLTSIDLSNFSTSAVTNMSHMFSYCSGLTSLDLTPLDTGAVTNMYNMFQSCSGLTTLDLSSFDTSEVTDMSSMFSGCKGLTTLDLSNFDTYNVTKMESMFSSCSSLIELDLSAFNTSNVEVMCNNSNTNRGLFSGCYSLTTLDLGNFDTSKVKSLYYMFSTCRSLKYLDLSSFDTSAVTNMGGMFSGCESLISLDLTALETSKVTNMSYMFSLCNDLTSLDLTPLDTGAVTNMSSMFSYCSGLISLDLTALETSKVTNMSYMFQSCYDLTSLDLTALETSKVTDMSHMFQSCNDLTSLDVSKFDTSAVTNMSYMFSYCSGLTTLDLSKWNTTNVTNMQNTFYECSSLIDLNVSNFDTSNVTRMHNLFAKCTNLTSLDLSKWNTSNVVYMNGMFSECSKIKELNLTSFNLVKVEQTMSMFDGCSSLTTIYANSDWQNGILLASTSSQMFAGCTKLVGFVPYDSTKVDITMANPTSGYFTVKPTETA